MNTDLHGKESILANTTSRYPRPDISTCKLKPRTSVHLDLPLFADLLHDCLELLYTSDIGFVKSRI